MGYDDHLHLTYVSQTDRYDCLQHSIVGAMGVPEVITTAEAWTAGTMVLLISTAYGFSVGPVVYNIVGEVPSTRVRAK